MLKVVAGLGFRQQTSCQALHQVLEQALSAAAQGQRQPVALQALATAADKCSHPALTRLAARLALPVQAVSLARLCAQTAHASPHVPARYGAQSLAEAAALAAAGLGAVLASPRCTSDDGTATAAIAFCTPEPTSP